MITITVDSHIRIPNLSDEWVEGLAKLCSIPNEEKETALSEKIWGAEKLDDLLTLADVEDNTLILPRGFLNELTDLLDESDHEYIILDKTVSSPKVLKKLEPLITFSDEQDRAIDAMHKNNQGRIIAPPGKGKTIIGLASVANHYAKGLIIIDKKHIAKQWQDRAEEHFRFELGFIGDNKWEEKYCTVALLQTLWSRREELDKLEWWNKWEMVLLDEQHHIPADTFTEILQRFPAKKRFGLSATIGKSEGKKRISELVFGPIIFESKESDLNPTIEIIDTGFDFDYIPTHFKYNPETKKKKRVQNNYQKLINTLVKDIDRNELIIDRLLNNQENANLIVSNRLNHLEFLYNLAVNKGFPEERCMMLTGKESLEERMEVYEKADSANCAVFATLGVAGEALDIPRLDRLYPVFPIKNEETYWQLIGRVARNHENKDSAIVYDFVDLCGPLEKQYLHRLRNLYQPKKLKVVKFGK